MKCFIYKPENGRYLNRFITTGTFALAQQFERVTLSGNVNEWLKHGFSIYENPCRKEFVNKRREEQPEYLDLSEHTLGDEVEVFGQKQRTFLYFPFSNQGVDFSEFYFNPTYLRSYHYAEVFAEKPEETELLLETCGGMTLWLNDELITDFIPFTRNMVKQQTVSVTLRQGRNKLIVCLDDLAERDTDYYFRIRYQGSQAVKMILPVLEMTDIEGVEKVEQMLKDISFGKETFISEPVVLDIENPLPRDLEIHGAYKPVADKIAHGERILTERDYTLGQGGKKLSLFHADEVRSGFYYFQISGCVDGIKVSRKIATQVFQKNLLEKDCRGIADRKKKALHYLADIEVDNVYKAASILAVGGKTAQAEAIILEELSGINSRKDCSDFHLIVVLQIWKLFEEKLSQDTKKAIEDTILNFRYWMDEPGDDVMWFFSENHSLLFHICQYYAGKLFPDKCFTNSGHQGVWMEQHGEELLEHWFDVFFREYITEWNSNAYIPVDVLGLCGLYNLAEEGSKWRETAKKALDCIFRDLALLEHNGFVMTTFGRSYEKESKGNYAAGTTSLLYLAYNKGNLNRASLAYISFILGGYEPPKEYEKYIGLSGDEGLIWTKTQGYESHVNLYLYKDSKVQLSTAIEFHPYQAGYQEHIIQATLDGTAQIFVNHPGEVQPYGNGRPNYWAGNGSLPRAVQYENLGVMIYHIPKEHPVAFTHAYIPIMEFDSYIGTEAAVAAEKNGGYLGVRALNGLTMQMEGPCKHREFISSGCDNVWIIMAGRKEEYDSLAEFHRQLETISIDGQDNSWEIQFSKCRKHDSSGINIWEQVTMRINEDGVTLDGNEIYHYPDSCHGTISFVEADGGKDVQ